MTEHAREHGYQAIDTSICVHLDRVAAERIALGDGALAPCRVLRRLDDGSLRSAVFTLPAGWQGVLEGAGSTQLFVLEGMLEVAGQTLGGCGFAVVPACARAAIHAVAATQAIVIYDAPATYSAPTDTLPVIVADALALPPFTPTIAGRRLDGFERRVLWEDASTGADTRLLRVPPGFRGGGPNWHPVNEEIFCIEGDIEPDATRPMRAGSFLWNPARSVHGFAEQTIGGCLLLEWHDGAWALHPEPGVMRP